MTRGRRTADGCRRRGSCRHHLDARRRRASSACPRSRRALPATALDDLHGARPAPARAAPRASQPRSPFDHVYVLRACSGTSASSGTSSRRRRALASLTVRNMPGFRRRSVGQHRAHDDRRAWLGSTRESMLTPGPRTCGPGRRAVRGPGDRRAVGHEQLGHGEIELDRAMSSSVVITVPGLIELPTLTRRRPTRPENGARM